MRLYGLIFVGLLLAAAIAAPLQDDFKRERGGKNDELKNSMEGKPPPKLEMAKWLNIKGKELAWKELKGKVVVLDFWAFW